MGTLFQSWIKQAIKEQVSTHVLLNHPISRLNPLNPPGALSWAANWPIRRKKTLTHIGNPNKFQACIVKPSQVKHSAFVGTRGASGELQVWGCRLSEPFFFFRSGIISKWGHFVCLPTRPLITLLPHISRPSSGRAQICGWLGSQPWATVLLFHSLLGRLTYSHYRLMFFFFSSPLCFFALSSLNLSTSCCSYASPVFCSAVLITVLFSCQETEYDEDMCRGREHLVTQSKHQTL